MFLDKNCKNSRHKGFYSDKSSSRLHLCWSRKDKLFRNSRHLGMECASSSLLQPSINYYSYYY